MNYWLKRPVLSNAVDVVFNHLFATSECSHHVYTHQPEAVAPQWREEIQIQGDLKENLCPCHNMHTNDTNDADSKDQLLGDSGMYLYNQQYDIWVWQERDVTENLVQNMINHEMFGYRILTNQCDPPDPARGQG